MTCPHCVGVGVRRVKILFNVWIWRECAGCLGRGFLIGSRR